MADLQGRKVFKVFNQDFIVDERYTVTKELGQGAYGIVWCVRPFNLLFPSSHRLSLPALLVLMLMLLLPPLLPRHLAKKLTNTPLTQRRREQPDPGGRRHQEGHKCVQQEDPGKARLARNQAAPALQGTPQRESSPLPALEAVPRTPRSLIATRLHHHPRQTTMLTCLL